MCAIIPSWESDIFKSKCGGGCHSYTPRLPCLQQAVYVQRLERWELAMRRMAQTELKHLHVPFCEWHPLVNVVLRRAEGGKGWAEGGGCPPWGASRTSHTQTYSHRS